MSEFQVSDFTDMLYSDIAGGINAPLPAGADAMNRERWEHEKVQRLQEIRELLRIERLEEQYQEPMRYHLLASEETGSVRIETYCVAGIKKLSMCVYVLRPEKENGRVILYLNGHDPLGARGAFSAGENVGQALGFEMAAMGYVVLVPELFGFGEAKRKDAPDADPCTSCSLLAPRLLNCGYSLVGMRVFEAMKTMDFAEAALGIHRFGVYGISGGGQVCCYTGILDTRIDAMMAAGYPNLYKYSILAMDHCICNYVPGQLELGESHQLLALAAPKKLLTINGARDPIFPIQGSLEAFRLLDEVYGKLGAGRNYTHILFDGGHENSIPDVCRWLEENYSVR